MEAVSYRGHSGSGIRRLGFGPGLGLWNVWTSRTDSGRLREWN